MKLDQAVACYSQTGSVGEVELGFGDEDVTQVERHASDDMLTSAKEASRVKMFRLMVVGMLVMTIAVTIMAYFLLGKEETQNFETAVRTLSFFY